jgi:hypothetical protein
LHLAAGQPARFHTKWGHLPAFAAMTSFGRYTLPRLQVCNQNAMFCMTSLRVAPDISRGIYPTKFRDGRTLPTQFGNGAGCAKIENKESNMLNKLLAAAAMAAIAYAASPANAAKVSAGCSGENLSKTESMVEAMTDGDAKIVAQKEISAAQDAMLAGKMGACAAHLNKAAHVVGAK